MSCNLAKFLFEKVNQLEQNINAFCNLSFVLTPAISDVIFIVALN